MFSFIAFNPLNTGKFVVKSLIDLPAVKGLKVYIKHYAILYT